MASLGLEVVGSTGRLPDPPPWDLSYRRPLDLLTVQTPGRDRALLCPLHRVLGLLCTSFLRPLYDPSGADHLGGRNDIEEERFAVRRQNHDWRSRQLALQSLQRLLGLLGPL